MKPESDPHPLAGLRNDLKLLPGPSLEDGSPTWTLHDPVRNRFYRIGWQEFELLARWHMGHAEQVAEQVNQETTLEVRPEDVLTFQQFLFVSQLLDPGTSEVLNHLKSSAMNPGMGFFAWLLRHYLFIRIPLVQPDRFLERTLPFVRWLISPPVLLLLAMAAGMSVFLVLRQWDAFVHTFLYFFSFTGILWYALAIFVSKLIHELGHAYASKYYGIHVPTMGLAFLVLWPMLYTDNSDAWKLRERNPRMMIVLAGTLVELVLAVLATLLWSFLAEGPLKSACFILATATWISSVVMNLNPFMRFDGYYFLSDFLDVPNLQNRSFALGKWYLRKLLLGLDMPCPESFPERKKNILIFYAYCTWIYRLLLFTGIALMVYHLFFKSLGIFLFVVEITWFVVLPIWKEFKAWWRHRAMIGCNGNVMITVLMLVLAGVLLCIPWKSGIHVPAVLKPGTCTRIYPPYAAQIRTLTAKNSQLVKAGDVLFELESPWLGFKEKQAGIRIRMLEKQLKRQLSRVELIEQTSVIQEQLAEALTELQGCRALKKQLRITAPTDGILRDMPDGLRPGAWLNKKQLLAVLTDPKQVVIEGYLTEASLAGIRCGNVARFYADSGDGVPVNCTVQMIDPTSSHILKTPYLASVYGGDLPVSPEKQGNTTALLAHQSLYRVLLTPDADGLKNKFPSQIMRGKVYISGEPRSLIYRAWLRVLAVFIRESGF